MTMTSLRYHFAPHLAVKHLETGKYLFLGGRPLFLSISEETAHQTKRFVSKINK
jgi:hypothetical protein